MTQPEAGTVEPKKSQLDGKVRITILYDREKQDVLVAAEMDTHDQKMKALRAMAIAMGIIINHTPGKGIIPVPGGASLHIS